MLERTNACLKQSGRLLSNYSKTRRGRTRFLHSNFWNHGAGDIDLPSWWLELLQRPQPIANRTAQSIVNASAQCLTTSLTNGGFLDFLYPTKSLALLHKLATRDLTHKNKQREARFSLRRGYSSDAPDGERIREELGDNERQALQSDGDTTDSKGWEDGTQDGPSSQALPSHQQSLQDFKSLGRSRARIQAAEKRLMDLDESDEWGDTVLEHAATELLEMTCAAVREHATYLVTLLESRKSHFGIHYFSMAVQAYFHVGDIDKSLYVYQEALAQHQDHEATPSVLRLTNSSQNWTFGAKAWDIFKQTPHDDRFFWHAFNDIDILDLVERAQALGLYSAHSADELGQSLSDLVREFATAFIDMVFLQSDWKLSHVPAKMLFDLFTRLNHLMHSSTAASQYTAILRQMLILANIKKPFEATAYGVYAVRIYGMMRQNTKVVPEQDILEDLFSVACRVHHAESRNIFQDLKSSYGQPSFEQYKRMLAAIEYDQDIKAFYSMLDEAREQHSIPWTPQLILTLLRMHRGRHEVKEVQAIFDNIEKLTGQSPTRHHRSALISAYVLEGDVKIAEAKIEKMKHAGIEPDAYIYRPILKHYSLRGDKTALRKYDHLLLDTNRPVPNFVVESFIVALTQTDELDEAQALLLRAQDLKISGSQTKMWNVLLNAYARQRNHAEVLSLHEQMCNLAIPEDTMTYSALIMSLVLAREPDNAYFVLRTVLPERSIPADTALYATVMAGYLSVGNSEKVMELHEEMMLEGLKPDFAIKTILIKALARYETYELRSDSPETMVLQRAEQLLTETIASAEAKDLAVTYRTPQRGSKLDPFREILAAGNFQFLLAFYGNNGAIEQAARIYDKFIQHSKTLDPEKPISPPRKILGGLMNVLRLGQQYEEVKRCWDLAYEKSKAIAARADADVTQPGWVLPSRRHILCAPLCEYMRSLIDQQQLSNIDALIASLRRDGYDLNSQAWNLYIQGHVLSGDGYAAFKTCEAELIQGWMGWSEDGDTRRASPIIGRIKWSQPFEHESSRRMPSYKTMVLLLSAYMDLRQRWTLSGQMQEKLTELVAMAPRTVEEVTLMPRMDDPIQMTFMQGR